MKLSKYKILMTIDDKFTIIDTNKEKDVKEWAELFDSTDEIKEITIFQRDSKFTYDIMVKKNKVKMGFQPKG